MENGMEWKMKQNREWNRMENETEWKWNRMENGTWNGIKSGKE